MRRVLSICALVVLAHSSSQATVLTAKELQDKWNLASTQMSCHGDGDVCRDENCGDGKITISVKKIKNRYYARFYDVNAFAPDLPRFAEVTSIWNAAFATRLWNIAFMGLDNGVQFSLTINSTLKDNGVHEGKEGLLTGLSSDYWQTHKFACTFMPSLFHIQGYSAPRDDK